LAGIKRGRKYKNKKFTSRQRKKETVRRIYLIRRKAPTYVVFVSCARRAIFYFVISSSFYSASHLIKHISKHQFLLGLKWHAG